MALFFIDRPVFAWVIAIIIMLAGLLAYLQLPVAQFPAIAPPQISITTTYPGASAQTLEDTVTQIIEQQMNGIDNLDYMKSTSESSGRGTTTITFKAGTNPDIAQVQVQNKLQRAMAMLPQEVQRQGVTVAKSSSSFLIVLSFISTDGSMASQDISDYVVANVQEPISRAGGVGEVRVFGSQYAMRIWCNPDMMRQFRLNPTDIVMAVQAQNAQIAGGQIGGAPQVIGQQINMTVIAASRLESVEEFENIILRINPDGSRLLLKDVANVELGGENYFAFSRFNGMSASGMAVTLATGANALNTAENVLKVINELRPFFPAGLDYRIAYDTTPFVKISIQEVFKTLGEAIILVFLVMYLFLQNFRTTLIPTIVVPVVLLGTFAVLHMTGFSLNTLTMFALVLAIGLLVDDAIVVVENVERLMHNERLGPRAATRKSMQQITGALFGMTTVLSAVFIPMAFFGGSVGVIYQQFSITIITAMAISLLMALILTPALCATLLKPGTHQTQMGLLGGFNRWFDKMSIGYQKGVHVLLRKISRMMFIYALLLVALGVLFLRMPSSFLPDEDQGILFTMVQLPPGSTFESTVGVLEKVEKHFLEAEEENIISVMAVAGFSFAGSGQNNAMCFIRLKHWDDRKRKDQHVSAVAGRALGALMQIPQATVYTFAPPAILELGTATGFDMMLQNRGGLTHVQLMEARNQLLGLAAQDPVLRNVRPNGLNDEPQITLDVDLTRAGSLGLTSDIINGSIAAYWGSSYINDFMDRGRSKKVYLQADKDFRMQESDFNRYYLRNNQGEMVPFQAFASSFVGMGSPRLERYNGVSAVEILGESAPGLSSGQAMDRMEELAKQLPEGFGISWTGMSYQERLSGAQAPILYALSILIVFLCLAALYESWSIPFSVMLVVPIGVLGAIVGATAFGMYNDVYFQVGLLATIGLSAKNAILIVEFARENQLKGMDLLDATLHAVRLRLRPVIMTSLAFVLGVMPLALSNGAGSGGQNAIGTGVICGVVAATTLGLYFIPVFYVAVCKVFRVTIKEIVHNDAE